MEIFSNLAIKLTLFGKACLVNLLAISQLVYICSIMPMPDPDHIRRIKSSISYFHVEHSDRIKRDTVIGSQLQPMSKGASG